MTTLSVNGETRVIGIFGQPIAHTRSPALHNAAFRALGLPYVYLPFSVPPAALGESDRRYSRPESCRGERHRPPQGKDSAVSG